jgi:hypothetical protein
MRFVSTLCAVVLVLPVVAAAQISQPDILQVDTGSRVRIAAPVFGPGKQVGTVISVTRDTLVLRHGASTSFQSVARSDITALEIYSGSHTNKAKGALWGLLIGAGSGGILGYTMYQEPKCQSDGFGCFMLIGPDSKGSNAALSAVAGGIVGIIAGTLFGMHATETWVPGTVGAK